MIQHHHSSPTAPARVVVLGASGFVGRNLIPHMAELGLETVSISSTEIDLSQPESVAKLQQVVREEDAIVFAAALTPDRGRDRRALLKNIAMGDHVSQFLENSTCSHFVYISSDAVYRNDEHPLRETSCCNPSDLYGLGHLVREGILVLAAKQAGVPLLLLRPCAVYGANDTHNSYGPNRFLRTAIKERQITLFGHGEEKRNHIYIKDLSHLIGLCLLHRSSGVFNAATGTATSFFEVAQIVAGLCGDKVQIIPSPRNNPITHRHFDITALLKAFPGFKFTSLQIGLAEALQEMMDKL